MQCKNPECEFAANPDPQVSVGYCCEKCEGRANGEEWAFGGKKKHTAYCTSNAWSASSGGGGGGGGIANDLGASHGPAPNVWGKCKNPDCWYMKSSDPTISAEFCCEKCEGRFNGEDWAMCGKAHWKTCEKIEVGGGGGYGPAGGWGGDGGWGDSWDGPYGGGKGMMMMMMMMMKGKGKGKGGWGPPQMYDEETEAKLDQWVAAKRGKDYAGADAIRNELRAQGVQPDEARPAGWMRPKKPPGSEFPPEQKVWLGSIPENVSWTDLKEIFNTNGSNPKHVSLNKGTGMACFDTAEEAAEAILKFNGSTIGEDTIQVDQWAATDWKGKPYAETEAEME